LPLPHFALLLISVAKLKLHPSKCAEVVEGLHCSLENGGKTLGKPGGKMAAGALSYLSFTLPPPQPHADICFRFLHLSCENSP